MILTGEQIQLVRSIVRDLAEPTTWVCLFGSRVHDEAVGGDVILLIELSYPVEAPPKPSVRISGRISRAQQGRKVDAVSLALNLRHSPIHEGALKEEQPL